MTKVTFEAATLVDAFKKANIVAPKRGEAFDQSGGIVLEILPDDSMVIVKATNGEIFHMEWVSAEIEGDAAVWRIASSVAAPIIASLPIGSGKEVILEEVKTGVSSHLAMKAGRTKAKFFLMDTTYYPEWDVFDPAELVPCTDLGGRVAMVEWCAGLKEAAPLNGINFTGELIKATDRYRFAITPLKLPGIETSITVPAGILGQVLKQTGDVMVGFTENQMLLMPNDTTQLRVVLYAGDYPTMARLMDRERPAKVTFKKSELLDILNRAILAAPGDRFLLLLMYVGKESITVKVDGPETAVLDSIDTPGQATHGRVEIRLTPKMLVDILNNAPNETVTMHYDPDDAQRVLYFDGGSGYEVWMVARRSNE